MTAGLHQPDRPDGPPWIGPMTPLRLYEGQWLGVSAAMLGAATVFFGWRGLLTVCGVAGLALAVFALLLIPLRLVGQRWAVPSFPHALNMGLLMGLTLPVMGDPWRAVVAAVLVGLLTHFMGPTRRLRVHPVAVTHLILVLMILWTGHRGMEAVLAPEHIVVGDVRRAAPPIGGPTWFAMDAPPPYHALQRPPPHRVMLDEQRRILEHGSRMIVLLKEGELPRLIDVLLGATPGPVGATSKLLLIVLGLYLMVRRIGRPAAALLAIGSAAAVWTVLPVLKPEGVALSAQCFGEVGWRVAVTYLGYQLLASPLLLIVLILAPLTMPRAAAGRAFYAVLLGGGVAAARWFLPYEWAAYLPLVAAGLLCPVLDRMRRSPFVERG